VHFNKPLAQLGIAVTISILIRVGISILKVIEYKALDRQYDKDKDKEFINTINIFNKQSPWENSNKFFVADLQTCFLTFGIIVFWV
jgi:hypothetical protein